jgi:uncharacterized membrane protein YgcG
MTISEFQSQIDISENGSIVVTETIHVTFQQERRGIYRRIPTAYPRRGLGDTKIRIDQIRVTDEIGRTLTTKIDKRGGEVSIRIGDADIKFAPGTKKTYIVEYRARDVFRWYTADDWGEYAELYWNAFGPNWEDPAQVINVTVNFPETGSDDAQRLRVYGGPFGSSIGVEIIGAGSNSNKFAGVSAELTSSRATITRDLPTGFGEDLTIVIGLPGELIDKPPFLAVVTQSVLKFSPALPGLIGSLYLFYAWRRWGRDPKHVAPEVLFEPSMGLGPSELGSLVDDQLHRRDITAAIINLAVKGHITIHPREEGTVFKKTVADLKLVKDGPQEGLTRFEGKLLTRIKKCGDVATPEDLRVHVGSQVTTLTSGMYEELARRKFYVSNPQVAKILWTVIPLTFMLGSSVLLAIAIPDVEVVYVGLGIFAGLASSIGFGPQMSCRTPRGAKAAAEGEAFAEFIRHREDYLSWVADKKADQVIFEEYLPYAVAFGLSHTWIKSFEGVLTEPPSWYVGPHSGFTTLHFADSFSTVNHSIATVAAAPYQAQGSSSGSGFSGGFSGGGGSSGGGFGGGGGGSW